jgi:hypothetical protein
MDGATIAAWLAAVAAIAAALLAGWSAVSSHRSASSVAEAVALEHDRRHHELTPRIRVEEGLSPERETGLWFTNKGPLDYNSVNFRLETPLEDTPVEAFLVASEWLTVGTGVTIAGDLGSITLGGRRFLYYRKFDDPELFSETTLRFHITCENERGTWPIHVEVEIA